MRITEGLKLKTRNKRVFKVDLAKYCRRLNIFLATTGLLGGHRKVRTCGV